MVEQTPQESRKAKALAGDCVMVLDAEQVARSVTRIAHEVIEKNGGTKGVAVVGIRTGGEFLAQRIVEAIKQIEGTQVPMGMVDITLYRDDISTASQQPVVRGTKLPFNVDMHTIVLVDDVLFTGRTIRAALDAIIDFGRPIAVQLAVLCDRGHRELPIRPDYVGKNLPTAKEEIVEVLLSEVDGSDGVYICGRKSNVGELANVT